MKTFRLIGMALLAIVLCANFTGCSKNDAIPESEEVKEYIVSLGVGGEISITESPLSRADMNKDLHGIQVYSCPNTKNSTTYTPYAYGLFDDVTSLKIKLLDGYKYKFIVTTVINGKDRINWIGNNKYGNPFSCYGKSDGSDVEIMNTFKYTSTEYFYGLGRGNSWSDIENTFVERPNLDRFYGEYLDYIPKENDSLIISMKRASFGVKFVADNFTEGILTISMEDAPKITIAYPSESFYDVFSFYYTESAYQTDNYSETVLTSISWEKNDGVSIPLGNYNITFKRNKLTTINIKIVEKIINNGIGIQLDEELEDGDNITIENGEVIDTTIDTPAE